MAKPKLKEHVIERSWCKGCGICVHFCPKNVLEMDDEEKAFAARPEDCLRCRLCELRCPDLALEVILEPADEKPETVPEKGYGKGEAFPAGAGNDEGKGAGNEEGKGAGNEEGKGAGNEEGERGAFPAGAGER